jgi:hypothetical protein
VPSYPLFTPCRSATPCYAMPCYAMLCYAMLCYAMLCYAGALRRLVDRQHHRLQLGERIPSEMLCRIAASRCVASLHRAVSHRCIALCRIAASRRWQVREQGEPPPPPVLALFDALQRSPGASRVPNHASCRTAASRACQRLQASSPRRASTS